MALSPPAELPRIWGSDRIEGLGARLKALACLTRVRLYRARVMARLLFGADAAALSAQWNRG
jgi:hypothetical protein